MRVLILGGTGFLGRAVTKAFIANGHQVVLLNRGLTAPHLFPGVEVFVADRSGPPPSELASRHWDAVVDLSAFSADHIRSIGVPLARNVGRYVLISSRSVYDWSRCADLGLTAVTEDAPVVTEHRDYAGGKIAAERCAARAYGTRLTTLRPGVIVGPHDRSDRFTWWVRASRHLTRLPAGMRVTQPVQVIDAEDVACFVFLLCENDISGVLNVTGPEQPIDLASLFQACRQATGGPHPEIIGSAPTATSTWPLVNDNERNDLAFRCDSTAAIRAGLRMRDLEASAAAVAAWDEARDHPPLEPSPW